MSNKKVTITLWQPCDIQQVTEKAFKVNDMWFPKSQIRWFTKDDVTLMALPVWLWKKNFTGLYTPGTYTAQSR